MSFPEVKLDAIIKPEKLYTAILNASDRRETTTRRRLLCYSMIKYSAIPFNDFHLKET